MIAKVQLWGRTIGAVSIDAGSETSVRSEGPSAGSRKSQAMPPATPSASRRQAASRTLRWLRVIGEAHSPRQTGTPFRLCEPVASRRHDPGLESAAQRERLRSGESAAGRSLSDDAIRFGLPVDVDGEVGDFGVLGLLAPHACFSWSRELPIIRL